MYNVSEFLALFNTSRLQSLIAFCLTSNDKDGLINVTSDKIKEQVLSTTTLKVRFLAVKHNPCTLYLINKQVGQNENE